MDHTLHQLVADHKIRCACIFVDQKRFRPGFHTLDHIRRLRSASAGILRAECPGVFSVRQIIDEHRNIRLFDASSVFGAQFYRRRIGDHIFSSVSGNMIIYAQFQCL